MPNGGTFTIESVFEGTDGYVASAINAVTVNKLVSIVFAQAIPNPPLTVPPPTTNSNSSAQITAQISFSDDTVQSDSAEVELFQAANPNLGSELFGNFTPQPDPPAGKNETGFSRWPNTINRPTVAIPMA